ncbi:uncharacterized protein IL334_002830 [Kwoniella shivajii]|uniref:tRNA (guanine(9)-N1)-methyltransferase n=1 Tax=Kwoniella shivajii TaxID=564305 RepID=A0ABZ1CX42_9TREE|nr:hypothetical protein IL334_002830 [Kwoniella shivajii]
MDEEDMMNASGSEVPVGEDPAQAGPSNVGDLGERPEGMSKNAMKRAAKQAKMDALKPLKRAAEKARRKERQRELAKGNAEGTLSESDKELFERRKRIEKERKANKRKLDLGEEDENDWKGAVVIDLGFDDLMNEQEINSMTSQIGFCYASNRTSPNPIRSVIHTSFSPDTSPRLWNKMIDRHWDKWGRSYWFSEDVGKLNELLLSSDLPSEENDIVSLDSIPISNTSTNTSTNTNTNTGVEEEMNGNKRVSIPSRSKSEEEKNAQNILENHLLKPNALPPRIKGGKQHTLIYLSADAEDEITELREDEIYVIGGIVDRNRYKNLCQNKAERLSIKTARLPIGKFIDNLPTRKVLTVNQVFDILVQYILLKDWKKAFETVIPSRKYHESKKAKHAHNSILKSDVHAESPAGNLREEGDIVEDEIIEFSHNRKGDDIMEGSEEAMMNQ